MKREPLRSNVVQHPAAAAPPRGFTGAIRDSFVNLMSGIGVIGRDKRVAMTYGFQALTYQQLEFAYRGHWLPRKIVDIPASDMTREWRQWSADDDQREKIEEFEKQFGILNKVMHAKKLARLYGGSAIILGVDQGTMDEELDLEKVGQDNVRFIHVVSKQNLAAGQVILDIESPYYGQPEYYQRSAAFQQYDPSLKGPALSRREVGQLSGGMVTIHPSRVIRFVGNPFPDIERAPDAWGDSVLQTVDDAIKEAGATSSSLAAMINEAKLDIVHVPGLTQVLSTEAGTNQLIGRFAAANAVKSTINGMILDTEEEWERAQITFEGMPQVLQAFLLLCSGAADIPATRLFGREPAGQNSTGESDMRNYNDRLKGEQKTELQPAMAPMDEVIIRASTGQRDPDIKYSWNSLWQMPETEKATTAFNKAQAYQIDVNAGLIPDEILRQGRQNQLIQDGLYPGLDAAIKDYEDGQLEDIDYPTGSPMGTPTTAAQMDPDHPLNQMREEQRQQEAETSLQQTKAAAANGPQQGNNRGVVRGSFGQGSGSRGRRAANDAEAPRYQFFHDAAPQPLYVRRDLLNKADLAKWAKQAGFKSMVTDPHVTLLYSKQPVDPMSMGSAYNSGEPVAVPPGGPRALENFGENGDGAVVLHFNHPPFDRRHDDMIDRGATHSHLQYQSHVTLTYKPGDVDLSSVEPYSGPLVFGPEIFRPISKDKPDRFKEK